MAQSISFQEAEALAKSGDREAQYALSSVLYDRNKFDESFHWLRLSAAQKLQSAQITLATFLMDGRRCQRDCGQAIDLLSPLAEADNHAALLLSELYGFSALGGNDRELALRFLLGAAQCGDAGALRQLALLCVCHGHEQLMIPLLVTAAHSGDAAAEDAALFYRAGAAGRFADSVAFAEAAQTPIDWNLLDEIIPQLAAGIHLPTAEILNNAPLVRSLPSVLHPIVSHTIIKRAAPLVQPSKIVDGRTGEARIDPRRNNANVTLGPRQHDHVLEAVELCISEVSGLPVLHGEFLQIMRYRTGEEFKPHVDYFQEGGYDALAASADGGQRAQTVLIFLNDAYEGGATRFPALRKEIKGRRGDVLHFHNLDAEGRGQRDSLHAGLPVLSGEKWLLSQWIRSSEYSSRLAW